MNEKINIIRNSTLLYLMAFLLTTILHEVAHALTGYVFHSQPVLHHNYVQHLQTDHLLVQQQVWIALAGPLFSFVQGIWAAVVFMKFNRQRLADLFLLWFAVLGLNNFLGYLMTGPFARAGDIGKVYALVNSPIGVQIGIAILAALALVFMAYKMTRPFLSFAYKEEWIADGRQRKDFSFRILFLPWILGSCAMTLLYLPVAAVISIVYPVMSGMIFIFPWQNANRIQNLNAAPNNMVGKFSFMVAGLVIGLIFVFKWVLSPGVML
jgi:hypothetical protein